MAKGNFLMNTVAGKLGEMVLYRSKGEQKSRTYVKNVANPKTAQQLHQRSQLSNIVAMYRAIKSDIRNGFEDKKAKESTYNAFVRANLNVTKVFLTKEQAAAQACVVAPYVVTKGSVRPIGIKGIAENSVSDLAVGALVIGVDTTVGELSAALVTNNSGITYGMKLSYLSVVQTINASTGYPMASSTIYGMELIEGDTTLLSDVLPVQAYSVSNGFLAHGPKVATGGFCWILSAKDSMGKLKVSTQALILTSGTLITQYTGAQASSRASISYGVQGPIPLNTNAIIAEPTAPQPGTVAGLTVKGSAPAGAELKLSVGDTIAIQGSNMDSEKVQLYINASGSTSNESVMIAGAKALAYYLTGISTSKTVISGAMLTNAQVGTLAVIYDGAVAWSRQYRIPEDMG